MATFLAAVVVVGLTVFAMSIGAVAQGRRLRGSCGQDCSCSPLAARNCRLREQRDAGPLAPEPAPPFRSTASVERHGAQKLLRSDRQ
jgi:hypothetical protein